MRALAPGMHRVWGARLSEVRFSTDQLVFEALPELRAALPSDWYREVTLSARQRGVLFKDERPVAYLRAGSHRFWCVDPSVHLSVFSVDEPMPELDEELLRLLPACDYVRKQVQAHERGLLMLRGDMKGVLAPGQYAIWSYPEAPVRIELVDMRSQQATLAAQELMTRDKVTLRLSLSAQYALADPALAATSVADVRDALYLWVQLAARDYVSGVTLDQLLEGRDAMTRYLEAEVVPKAALIGVRVERVGVKDVVLPGEMKILLNRVIEAEKAAAANVILRREEAAATRLLASSARVMAEQPVLLRLKELETLKEMAARIDEVRVVVAEGGLSNLLPAQLLGGRA
ncbi:MAG TPA: slipin family protein [Polyangiales bacterium]|nr:slipin family protein [Polyangiales bacterium]